MMHGQTKIKLTITGAIYPLQNIPFGTAFVSQPGNFCTQPRIFKRYLKIRVMKNNSMHYLSSVYFVIQPLHVSAIFVAHHQEVYCIYTTISTCCVFSWLSVGRVGMEYIEMHGPQNIKYLTIITYNII